MSGYNTVIKQACSLSDESVFTAYSNDMLRQFDIFALKKSDIINDKVNQYIKTSINTHSKDIQLVNAQYDEYRYMTDNGGYGVEEQIVRYMQSGGYIDVIRDYNSVKDINFGVGQISSMDEEELMDIKDKIMPYMEEQLASQGINMIFFMLTNMIATETLLIALGNGAGDVIENGFDAPKLEENVYRLEGVVSRKKQLIPEILTVLSQE